MAMRSVDSTAFILLLLEMFGSVMIVVLTGDATCCMLISSFNFDPSCRFFACFFACLLMSASAKYDI